MNRQAIYVVIALIIVVISATAYILFNYPTGTTSTNTSTPTTTYTPPSMYQTTTTSSVPPLNIATKLYLTRLKKTSYYHSLVKTKLLFNNGCLNTSIPLRYGCINELITLLRQRYRLNITVDDVINGNISFYNVSSQVLGVLDYTMYLRINNTVIEISLVNGEVYFIGKYYTWSEFNKLIRGFDPEKYRSYSVDYISSLLYNTTRVNLSLYGEPEILDINMLKNVYDIIVGYGDEALYTIYFTIDNTPILVSNNPPKHGLTAYVFIFYNDKYVAVGYKRHIPVATINNILPRGNCSIDLNDTVKKLFNNTITGINVVNSTDVFFIKKINNDFYYNPGKLYSLLVTDNNGKYIVELLIDLNTCSIYDYAVVKYI